MNQLRKNCRLVALIGLVVLLGSGCGNNTSPPLPGGDIVRYNVKGAVTYKGNPVPWGYVVFYLPIPGMSLDAESGAIRPVGVAPIVDGKYDAVLPAGMMVVSVVADPKINAMTLLHPVGEVPPTSGGPPGLGGPPGFPGPGGPPDLPNPGGPPGFPGPGPFPMPPEPPPLPPDGNNNPILPPETPEQGHLILDPGYQSLSKSQQTLCDEIHEKFGTFAKAKINFAINDTDVVYDIRLK